jgi:hypothetical protein
MELINADWWLLALKDGDVTFDDIKKTINRLPESGKFDYDVSNGKHAVFHMILNDLDKLCSSEEAIRTFERVNETEVSEIYRITPKGRARAENLLL